MLLLKFYVKITLIGNSKVKCNVWLVLLSLGLGFRVDLNYWPKVVIYIIKLLLISILYGKFTVYINFFYKPTLRYVILYTYCTEFQNVVKYQSVIAKINFYFFYFKNNYLLIHVLFFKFDLPSHKMRL